MLSLTFDDEGNNLDLNFEKVKRVSFGEEYCWNRLEKHAMCENGKQT